MSSEFLKFPNNFLWGAATSAYQVEGNNSNDWSQWEIINCKKLAWAADSARLSKIKKIVPLSLREKISSSAKDPKNYISGLSCNHYNLFLHDFDIAKRLHHNAHRFSIEWSRIEPEEGKFQLDEIKHYKDVVKCLKERNMEPFITLWHFTNPLWLRDKGGWKAKNTIQYYSRYVNKVVENLKDDVKYYITINEPLVYAASSYLLGRFPAQEKNPFSFFLAINNLIKAHKSANKIIKKINPNAQVGIAKSIIYFDAFRKRILNILLKKFADWLWNNYFLDRIKFCQDFIGVNHYFYNRINYGFNKNENKILSDMGWELYPEAMYYSLRELRKYGTPIYITENGLSDADDDKRAWYIKDVLKNVHRAIKDGVDVNGYFYWSLLDNFEWHNGFWPRFGLIEMDYSNLKRIIRESAIQYAEIIKCNGIAIN